VEEQLRVKLDDEEAIQLRQAITESRHQLSAFIDEQHDRLKHDATQLASRVSVFDQGQIQYLTTIVANPSEYQRLLNDIKAQASQRRSMLMEENSQIRSRLMAVKQVLD